MIIVIRQIWSHNVGEQKLSKLGTILNMWWLIPIYAISRRLELRRAKNFKSSVVKDSFRMFAEAEAHEHEARKLRELARRREEDADNELSSIRSGAFH